MYTTKEEIKEAIANNIAAIEELCFEFIDAEDFTIEDKEAIEDFITELFSLRDERRNLFALRDSIED